MAKKIKRIELYKSTTKKVNETQVALQKFYDALNQGQKKKVVKEPEIKKMLDDYGVEYIE